MSWQNLPRERIPWYPRIDFSKCIGCQSCFNFCKNGVYEWDEAQNRPVVKQPMRCVVGCSSCSRLCPAEAISFPTRDELKRMIEAGQLGPDSK
ncbi:MAG: 4Fe-4S dicluster domain-containing protein [Desulfofundulus sp.]